MRRGLAAALSLLLIGAVTFLLASRLRGPEPIARLDTMDYHALAISPLDPNIVFFGHHQGVMFTRDGGFNWQPLPIQGDAMGLAIHPAAPQTIYATGHYVFSKSTDGGATWQAVSNDLPDLDIHGFAFDPRDAQTMYAFVVRYGLFISRDGGAHWEPLSRRLPDSVMSLAASGTRLYAGTMDSGLWISDDAGKTWRSAESHGLGRAVMGLVIDPADSNALYVGTANGVMRSPDRGLTWSRLGPEGVGIVTLAVAPTNPKTILAVSYQGRVYRSRDGGDTWRN